MQGGVPEPQLMAVSLLQRMFKIECLPFLPSCLLALPTASTVYAQKGCCCRLAAEALLAPRLLTWKNISIKHRTSRG